MTTLHAPLGILDIELTDGLGRIVVDPNHSAMLGHTGSLPLHAPKLQSELSGKPAFGYRTDQVTLALAEDELLRLMRHDLRPDEVKQLMETHGVFHEIHSDFYDHETFKALQPMESGSD